MKKKSIIIATAMILAVALLFIFDLYRCPLNFVFGIPCPMCGMTRAVISAFSGDFAGAFYYHPLWILIIVTCILIILYELKLIRPPKRVVTIGCIIVGIALVACYIIRLINHSDVVMPHFQDSLIYRVWMLL